ncbi:MAG: hypothetical protein M1812_005954 [Candelaria pacifica]|nr:MAG: hypothetical protein M1812_005954 [Candelaria pacifica]
MKAHIICDPPLDQVTVVPRSQTSVDFVVLIDADQSSRGQSWEAAVWHNFTDPEQWEALSLEETTDTSFMLCINSVARDVHQRCFVGSIEGLPKDSRPVRFTVRFRSSPSDGWRWVNEQSAVSDGELCYQTSAPFSKDLSEYIEGLGTDHLKIQCTASETPETSLWSITTPVSAARGAESGFTDVKLGLPKNYSKWFAIVRLWSPWLAPRHGKGRFCPDKDAILCSFLRQDGLHLVLLAVSGVEDVLTVFKPDGDGNVVISARNDIPGTKRGLARIVVAVGKSFESANAAVMYHARKIVKGDVSIAGELQAEQEAMSKGEAHTAWSEDWYDGLTFCTYNGLGMQLNEQLILNGLNTLAKNNIKITNLIIDDNWQSLDDVQNQYHRGWTDFEANKAGFPNGLKHTVNCIKKDHSNIKRIAVWHALFGYWGGISPTGNIAKTYKTVEVRKKTVRGGDTITVVDEEDVQRYFNDFYSFLAESGIDSVKTDVQFMLDDLDDPNDRRRLITAYQDAWAISSLRSFSSNIISCMSQTPQILFHSQLPTNRPRILVRNSDDFFPDVASSHPWHIFCNAHNSLFTQHLNIIPDWDMFQTSHPWGRFHAAARCVSGGAIYITDTPGVHDMSLIQQMTAQTPRGNTIILRPHTVGKTTQAYIGYEEYKLLKVGTYVGKQKTGTGILGVFNATQAELTELISIREFPGVMAGAEYIVRAHSGQVSSVMTLEQKTALIKLELPLRGWEILSAYPIHSFNLEDSDIKRLLKVAVLGLLGKMTGAAAVISSDLDVESNGRLRIRTSLKALGILGLYISDLREKSIEGNFLILILGQVVPLYAVRCSDVENVLEIDVERAWKDLGLSSGWSNEVGVEIFIG